MRRQKRHRGRSAGAKRPAKPPKRPAAMPGANEQPNRERLLSINALSEELRIDRRTLKKHLSEIEPAGLDGKSKLYRKEDAQRVIAGVGLAKDGFAALRSKQIEEQTREASARADLLELERAEKRRELVPLAEVQTMISDALLPVRQRFLAAPAELCNRANPTDPQFAREAIQHWVDESLRLIRDELPKPTPQKQ